MSKEKTEERTVDISADICKNALIGYINNGNKYSLNSVTEENGSFAIVAERISTAKGTTRTLVTLEKLDNESTLVTVCSAITSSMPVTDSWGINKENIDDMICGITCADSSSALPENESFFDRQKKKAMNTATQPTNYANKKKPSFWENAKCALQCEYCGGHIGLDKVTDGVLSVYPDRISFGLFSSKFVIPMEQILECSIKTQEQITQSPTLAGFLLVGMLAFAFQKKKVNATHFLTIRYISDGSERTLLFRNKQDKGMSSMIKTQNTIERMRLAYK